MRQSWFKQQSSQWVWSWGVFLNLQILDRQDVPRCQVRNPPALHTYSNNQTLRWTRILALWWIKKVTTKTLVLLFGSRLHDTSSSFSSRAPHVSGLRKTLIYDSWPSRCSATSSCLRLVWKHGDRWDRGCCGPSQIRSTHGTAPAQSLSFHFPTITSISRLSSYFLATSPTCCRFCLREMLDRNLF